MRHAAALLFVCVLLLSFGLTSTTVSAQTDADWCYVFVDDDHGPLLSDFATITLVSENFNDGDIPAPPPGSYNALNERYEGEFNTTLHSVIAINITLPLGSTFTAIGFEYGRTRAGAFDESPRPAWIYDLIEDENIASQFNKTATIQVITAFDVELESVQLAAMGYKTGATAPGVYINRIAFEGIGPDPFEGYGSGNLCEDQLVRPLTEEDEDEWGLFENPEEETVIAFSDAPGAPVHAAGDGTIVAVGGLSKFICSQWLQGNIDEIVDDISLPGLLDPINLWIDCLIVVPPEVHDVGGTANFYYTLGTSILSSPLDDFAGVIFGLFPDIVDDIDARTKIDGVTVVVLELVDGRQIAYFVSNENVSVVEGQTVEAGCVLGETVSMRGFVGALPSSTDFNVLRPRAEQGVTVMGMIDPFTGEHEELLSELITYPSDSNPCAAEYADCMGDATFANASTWQTIGEPYFTGEGVILDSGDAVYTTMNLNGEINISMKVFASNIAGTDRSMRLQLGTIDDVFVVPALSEITMYELELAGVAPDSGLFYTVLIADDSIASAFAGLGLWIHAICISNYEGDDPTNIPVEEPPFSENCGAVEQPATETLVAQIGWLWNRQNEFFQCDLMKMLNSMFKVMQNTYQLMGWLGRYGISVGIMNADWLGSNVFPWLNGHFSNMANGRVTFIEVEGGGTCNNLFCVIEALFGSVDNIFNQLGSIIRDAISEVIAPVVGLLSNIIGMTAEFLFNLLTAIVSTGLRVINTIFMIFQDGSGLLYGLVISWNTTPATTIPGLPQCQVNPEENGFCMFMWLLENTIFSGTGSIILTIAFAYGSISLVLYVIKESRQILTEIGQQL